MITALIAVASLIPTAAIFAAVRRWDRPIFHKGSQ